MCKIARVVNLSGSYVQQNTTTCRLSYDHISNLIYPKCIIQDVPCNGKQFMSVLGYLFLHLLLNATNSIPLPWSDSIAVNSSIVISILPPYPV